MRSYTASPGRYTNTGCRAVLVSLFGPSYLTVIGSLFLVRHWIQCMSVYFGFCGNRDRYAQCLLCLFREIPQMQFLDKVYSHFVVPRQVPACLDIPVVAQRQFPMVHLFMLLVQFSDKVFGVVHSPLDWCTIVATANVVTSSSSADCPDCCRSGLRRDVVCGWWFFHSWCCSRCCLGQCEADD